MVRALLAWLSVGLALICVVLSVGTVAWQIPGIGRVGAFGGHVPGWLILLAAFGLVTGVLAWRQRRSATIGVAIAACVLSLIASAVVIADQRAAMHAVGVHAEVWDFFGPFLGSAAGPDDVITYGPVDGRSPRMAVYRPRSGAAAAPVVVNVHGGGWVFGDEVTETAFSRYLADRGFLVFSPTYTLATATRPTWELAPREIACAIATANRVSTQYGGAPQRFYLAGESAGANLAVLVSNRLAAGQPFGDDCGTIPRVGAVAVNVPVMDPGQAHGNSYAFTGKLMRRYAETYTGGTPESVPERYAAVNASSRLSADSPPTLVVYGPNDQLVPQQGTLTYAQRARDEGVDVKAVGMPWTGHGIRRSGAGGKVMAELTVQWFNEHR
jgi:acetyl esterase